MRPRYIFRKYTDIHICLPTKFFCFSLPWLRGWQHEKKNFGALKKQLKHLKIYIFGWITSLRVRKFSNFTKLLKYLLFFLSTSFSKIFYNILNIWLWDWSSKLLGVSGQKEYFDPFQCKLSSLRYKMTHTSSTNPDIIWCQFCRAYRNSLYLSKKMYFKVKKIN